MLDSRDLGASFEVYRALVRPVKHFLWLPKHFLFVQKGFCRGCVWRVADLKNFQKLEKMLIFTKNEKKNVFQVVQRSIDVRWIAET